MRAVSDLSVLIVDDDPDAAYAARTALEQRGYQAAVITDGMKALRFLMDEQNPAPAMILIELMVPGLDAGLLRRVLKYDRNLGGVPVVAISSARGAENVAAEIEADAYLRKPLDTRELLSLVERYCGAPPIVRLRR